jgi:hypothetical protein
MKIRLNPTNSKVINGKVYITAMKAHKLNHLLSGYVNNSCKINHPTLGLLIEYTGPYTRRSQQ